MKRRRRNPEVWLHGTSTEAAEAIMREGLRGRSETGRGWMAPLAGRVYLTKRPAYALTYALRGHVEPGSASSHLEPEGVVFETTFDGAAVPDEDWLGEMLDRMIGRRDLPDAADELVRAVWLALPSSTTTPWTRSRQRGEYAFWARIGKTAIRALQRTRAGQTILVRLAAVAPAVSVPAGDVRVLAGWLVKASAVRHMAPPDAADWQDHSERLF